MRRQDESKKSVILDFIDEYYNEYNEIPAVRTIAEGTGIALATVHRYLLSLKESGELEYNGRKSISTKRIDLESRHAAVAPAPTVVELPTLPPTVLLSF